MKKLIYIILIAYILLQGVCFASTPYMDHVVKLNIDGNRLHGSINLTNNYYFDYYIKRPSIGDGTMYFCILNADSGLFIKYEIIDPSGQDTEELIFIKKGGSYELGVDLIIDGNMDEFIGYTRNSYLIYSLFFNVKIDDSYYLRDKPVLDCNNPDVINIYGIEKACVEDVAFQNQLDQIWSWNNFSDKYYENNIYQKNKNNIKNRLRKK